MSYQNYFKERLKKLEDLNLLRHIPHIEAGAGKYITVKNKRCLNLSSNNYLGLSLNKNMIHASKEAIAKYGCSSSGSRIVTGNYSVYDELERETADFKGYESCLVLGCGYIANLSVISAICDKDWLVFSDKLNHASIVDGVKLSLAKHIRYKHNDMKHLSHLLRKYDRNAKKIIITDTVFSMDGDIADLKTITELAKEFRAMVMVDEAHATGIFGKGAGIARELGLEKMIDINMGTFSKAIGSYGAYVCSSKAIIDYLINKTRGFIFSTSLPPAVTAANLAAIKLIRKDKTLSERLIHISRTLREELKKLNFNTLNSQTHIIPVVIGDRDKLFFCRDFLIDRGIYAAAIRPPTVPIHTDRLRLSLRADLTDKEIKHIIKSFKELAACL